MTYRIDRGVAIAKTKLHPNPWNPNHMKPRQQEAVAESISKYGQVIELLVRPHPENEGEYQIIDGEHRFNVLPDIVYCNVIHDISDAEAKKLTVVMNETRGEADKIELAQLLASISEELEDLAIGLPYEMKELEELTALADIDWDNYGSTEEEEDDGDPTTPDEGDKKKFENISVVIPEDAMDVIRQARDLIEQERTLSPNEGVAWGQVIEVLAAEYLAMPR